METMRQAPLRAVVIVGDAKERSAVLAACRHLGLALDGCAGSGLAGMALIETLATPPDLAIVDLRVTDMDGADLIRSLSMLDAEIGLVLCGADCPRLQDTALVLAAALGMRGCAAVAGPVSAAVLSAAVAESMASRGRAGAAAKPFEVPDAIDIRSGLLRDEFELYYQPKVALAHRKPHGVEALLRMALDDSAALRAAGHMLPVAVNLSPRALANPDLAGDVADAVRRSGVPPQAVMFEVT
ncbi:EAL domain-containing protein [Pseudoduganella aquatica]|uniref:EAL domain-containing protein n=1 Tax=Pseudoduganella aquatica TaxID=2660641 RepID=UPI001E3219C2|nr:EAL domain-containing response regulator [Pseudoduganella aquatica]